MKKYKVVKTYIIQAEDDIHLKAILLNGAVNSIERYRISQDIITLRTATKKKGWNPWVVTLARQLKYLVTRK